MRNNNVFSMDIKVRFRDIDARQHVNNAVYFTYFENGRLGFYNAVLHKKTLSEITFILARTECNFIKSIALNDPVRLELWVKKIGSKSVAFAYRIVNPNDTDVVYAIGESVQVCFNYQQNASMPIPEDLKSRFSEYLLADAQ